MRRSALLSAVALVALLAASGFWRPPRPAPEPAPRPADAPPARTAPDGKSLPSAPTGAHGAGRTTTTPTRAPVPNRASSNASQSLKPCPPYHPQGTPTQGQKARPGLPGWRELVPALPDVRKALKSRAAT
jgi:hypothetical protein